MGPRILRAQAVFAAAVAVCCLLFSAHAESTPTLGALEADSSSRAAPSALARLTVSPLALSGGSSLTVISPESWTTLSDLVENGLEATHKRLTNLFGQLPPVSASVRLMTMAAFTRATGAPEWTNALYVRGQILIPIGAEQLKDHQSIVRSVSHEYTHAVVSALSKGKAPGWLDEGLAQWIEGEENPVLKPALYEWLSDNDPIPLAQLQGGFTKLPAETVPAAYAQSLLSTTIVLNTYGFDGVRTFFDALRAGSDQQDAMELAFNVSGDEFEARLSKTLVHWRNTQSRGRTIQASVSQSRDQHW